MKSIPESRGSYASRKFLLAILCMIILVVMALAAALFPGIPAIFPSFVGGICGIATLYFGGNVANKYVVGKVMNQAKEDELGD